jgi:hypothetical protein
MRIPFMTASTFTGTIKLPNVLITRETRTTDLKARLGGLLQMSVAGIAAGYLGMFHLSFIDAAGALYGGSEKDVDAILTFSVGLRGRRF